MKKVAFDLGNVIVGVSWQAFIDEWNRQGLQKREDPVTFFNDLQGQQDIGVITIDAALRNRFDLKGDKLRRLRNAWDSALLPSETMVSFMNSYKKAGYSVAILSNMGKEHAAIMRKEYPSILDGAVLHLSFEVGARKPAKLYFQSFITENPEFSGATFVDDRLENVLMAQKCGLRGCLFDLFKFEQLPETGQNLDLARLRKEIG